MKRGGKVVMQMVDKLGGHDMKGHNLEFHHKHQCNSILHISSIVFTIF